MERDNSGAKVFFLLFDLFLLNIAVYLVLVFSPIAGYLDHTMRDMYFLHANIAELIAYNLYGRRNYFFTDSYTDRVKIFGIRFIILLSTLIILAQIFLPRGHEIGFILEYTTIFFIIKVSVFYFIYLFHKYLYRKGYAHQNVAILGNDATSKNLGKLIKHNPSIGFKFTGFVLDNNCNSETIEGKNIIGCLKDLSEISEIHKINMLFVTNPQYFTVENTKNLLELSNKTGLRLRYVLTDGYWNGQLSRKRESAKHFEMFNPQQIPLDAMILRFEKRFFDIVFSLEVIVFIFSWLFPLIAIMIKFSSKGPIFFIQKRTGINNKTFKCYKFRTMAVNKDSDTKQAQVNDARITKVGSFLRKTNMDELPQFFNVFLGNMSVVGPRPHMLKHTEQYSALIEHYKVRHFVKPGITGWAQINGYRGLTDELWKMEKRVEFDMEYLSKWSLFWDVKIIYLTVVGKNAYANAG